MKLIYTVFTKNYLAHARTLAHSVSVSNPTVHFVAILLDDPKGFFDPSKELFEILQGSQILQDRLKQKQLFRFNARELCCAVKPLFASYLLETRQVRELLYLDSDMVVLGEVAKVFADLDTSPIVLFPQVLQAHSFRALKKERVLITNGIFNAGMFLVSCAPEAHNFLSWWLERNLFDCPSHPQSGNFLDQKWLNLAPIFYPTLRIYRGSQCNVARWNLYEREIAYIDGVYLCNSEPLITWHMSLLSNDVKCLQYYSSCATADSFNVVSSFCKKYLFDLNSNGLELCLTWPYSFEYFDNGKRIYALLRKLVIVFDRRIADDYQIYSSGTLSIIYSLVKSALRAVCMKLRARILF